MKSFFKLICLSFLLVSLNLAADTLILGKSIQNGETVEFLKFSGPGEWSNYLAMNLPFAPMVNLFQQVEAAEKLTLKNRGEAHITVVTPVEYWNILKPRLITISEIDQIAESMRIQKTEFDVLCLGMGKAIVKGKEQKTFFVVVQSDQLLNIRRKIQELLVAKGGKKEEFDPSHFYPHITLGYTEDDLHESHGVIKDINSCIHSITLK